MNDRPDGTFRLLFVCTGNTCRSPMAEAIARRRLAELGWDRVEARSAGVAAYDGSPASGGALRASAAHGLDLATHSATLLTEEEAGSADLILTMSESHLMRVGELGGGDRAALLTSFAGGAGERGAGSSIPDPAGGPDEEYLETFTLLDELVTRVIERLAPVVAP
jgi:protein-tyrosine-phosphatase